jgi:PTH1 family peptidyl-tRNA hydrolase
MAVDTLVVGLGNPGKQYARTRHNVGEECVAILAARHGVTLKSGRDDALVAECAIGMHQVALAFPLTFMNESGRSVQALMRRYYLTDPLRLIVVHDELDLPPSVVRVKSGGGLAGNNGLRSITAHLHTQDYLRVRIGIGKPSSKEHGAAHVLSKLSKAEREQMDVAVQLAADAVETILTDDLDAAQRRFNSTLHDPPPP